MTQITNFNIAEDLIVEAYLPNAGSNAFLVGISLIGGDNVLADASAFIVGVSLIGGTDVLSDSASGGGAGLAWQEISCEVSSASIAVGGEVQSNLYFQPTPATMALTIQSWELDPNNNIGFRSGVPIRLRLSSGPVQKTLFNGFIDNIDVTYRPDGPNLIAINAYDKFKRYVNTRLTALDTTTGYPGYVTPNEQLAEIAQALGTTLSAQSITTEGRIPSVNVTEVIASDYIYEAIQNALGIFWVDQETGEFVIIPRPSGVTPPVDTWIIGNNHGDDYHLCLSDITTTSDPQLNVNNLKVILESDSATFTVRRNTDAIELYGETAEDVTLNTTDLAQLDAWADRAYVQFPAKLVGEVQTPAIDRTGTLTQAAFFDPGALVGVRYQTPNIDVDDYYTVTRVRHEIDVNNWFTTLELWKEF